MGTIGILLTISSIVFSFILIPSVILFQLISSSKMKEHKQIISSMMTFQNEKELLSNYNLLFSELQKTNLDREKINKIINVIKTTLMNSKEKGKLKNSFLFNKKVLIDQFGNVGNIENYLDIKLTKKLVFKELKNIELLKENKIFRLKNTENIKIALLAILVLYVTEPSFIGYLKHNKKYDYIFEEFKFLANTKSSINLFRAKHKILKSLAYASKSEGNKKPNKKNNPPSLKRDKTKVSSKIIETPKLQKSIKQKKEKPFKEPKQKKEKPFKEPKQKKIKEVKDKPNFSFGWKSSKETSQNFFSESKFGGSKEKSFTPEFGTKQNKTKQSKEKKIKTSKQSKKNDDHNQVDFGKETPEQKLLNFGKTKKIEKIVEKPQPSTLLQQPKYKKEKPIKLPREKKQRVSRKSQNTQMSFGPPTQEQRLLSFVKTGKSNFTPQQSFEPTPLKQPKYKKEKPIKPPREKKQRVSRKSQNTQMSFGSTTPEQDLLNFVKNKNNKGRK